MEMHRAHVQLLGHVPIGQEKDSRITKIVTVTMIGRHFVIVYQNLRDWLESIVKNRVKRAVSLYYHHYVYPAGKSDTICVQIKVILLWTKISAFRCRRL